MRSWLGLLLVFCFLASFVSALEIGGSYENYILTLLKKDGTVGLGDLNRLRLKLDQEFAKGLNLYFEPRYYFLAKSQEIAITGASDLDQLIFDRAFVKYRLTGWSLTAGKQRIAWGTGFVWNPVDIFNPLFLSFAAREEDKTNVSALRLELPLGVTEGVDLFVVAGQPWEQTAKGVRFKGSSGLFDLGFSYVDQGGLGHQIGLDTAGDIFTVVGVRGEVAFKTGATGNGYTQATLGGDYTFDNGIGLKLEYYFNGLGSRASSHYNWGSTEAVGRDYLFIGGNRILDELTTVNLSLLANLNDASFMLYPQYQRSLAQDLDLSLEAMILGGPDGSEFVPPASQDPLGFGGSKMALVKLIWNF